MKWYEQQRMEAVHIKGTCHTAHQFNAVCVLLRVLGAFILKSCFNSQGLEFNQQESSLSHKEKALKSYYNAQSL